MGKISAAAPSRAAADASYYIDKYPVTNAEFKKFFDETNTSRAKDHNFLRHWKDGTFPAGWANKPVTWVSLEDARAYAVGGQASAT